MDLALQGFGDSFIASIYRNTQPGTRGTFSLRSGAELGDVAARGEGTGEEGSGRLGANGAGDCGSAQCSRRRTRSAAPRGVQESGRASGREEWERNGQGERRGAMLVECCCDMGSNLLGRRVGPSCCPVWGFPPWARTTRFFIFFLILRKCH